MRIKTFCKLIEDHHLEPHILRGCVVVDAQSFFFNLYRTSGLPSAVGCDCSRYANYLRSQLTKFKKANVKCYFIYRGGEKNYQFNTTRYQNHYKKMPIFMKHLSMQVLDEIGFNYSVCEYESKSECVALTQKQVLEEIGFNYSVCEYESKSECVALAQKLSCPVISFNIEYCFFGVPYIPYNTLRLNEDDNTIHCGLYSLDTFLQQYKLTEDKLATFAALTDERNFPENHFMDFIKTLKIHIGHYRRNVGILNWLATNEDQRALIQIFRYISSDDKKKFLEVKENVRELIRRREVPGVPSKYLENETIEISEHDPLWFQKGVASKRIAIPLAHLTRCHVATGSWVIDDSSYEDAMLLSIDIIKYAYNLLTNFERQEITFLSFNRKIVLPVTDSVGKPEYEAVSSPFENGWERLPPGLLEHFMSYHLWGLRGVEGGRLWAAGGGEALLILALLYFARKKAADTRSEAYSVLLTSLLLSGTGRGDGNDNAPEAALQPDRETLDDDELCEDDIENARFAMKEYLAEVSEEEARQTNLSLLHSLVQFQHCLQWLGYLNELCGRPLPAVSYSRVYSAGAVWRVAGALRAEGGRRRALRGWLAGAPALLAALLRRIDLYEELLAEVMSDQ